MRAFLSVFAAATLLVGGSGASAADKAEIHTFHCWMSCPIGTPATNDLVVRENYSLSSNDQTKFADWVAYRTTPATIGSQDNRDWKSDPWLSREETLEEADYTDAPDALKIDRGHQAPLASFAGTPTWKETNLLSNITPQRSELNRGPWKLLEEAERKLVRREKVTLYVITGPLYERTIGSMPKADEAHRVPSGFWKVVVTEKGELTAFIFEQETPRAAKYCDHQRPLAEVEERSGLALFPRRPKQTFPSLAKRLGC